MKKFYCLIGLISLCVIATNNIMAGQSQFGLKAGMNIGIPVGKIVDGAKGAPKMQPIFGGFYKYEINPKWALKTEINYVILKAGFESPYDNFFGSTSIDGKETNETLIQHAEVKDGVFKVSYLQIPLMVVNDIGKNFNLVWGVYGSRVLTKEMSGEALNVILASSADPEGIETKDSYIFDEGKNINDWEFGLNLGVEYEFVWGLTIDLRTTASITSFFDKDWELAPARYATFNIQAGLAYRLAGKQMF